MSNDQVCSGGPTLVFACSGAADVGAVADQTARRLAREGKGKMFCLMGVGGRVGGIMKTTQSASKILAIDGCPMDCARHTLEQAGFKSFAHLQLADIGMEKGKTAPDDRIIGQAFVAACQKLDKYAPQAVEGDAGKGCSCS